MNVLDGAPAEARRHERIVQTGFIPLVADLALIVLGVVGDWEKGDLLLREEDGFEHA